MAIRVRGQQTAASSPSSPSLSSSSSSSLVNLGKTTLKVHMEKGVGVSKKRKAGRKKFTETRHPVYKGVRQRSGKWVGEMRQPDHNKSRVWLGTFTCPETAARAYDLAAFALKGESAELNFPDEVQKSLSSACRSDSSTISLPAALRISTMVNLEEQVDDDVAMSRKVYVDEDELFNMPVLLNSMAEGLILTPPAMQKGFNWDNYDFEIAEEFSLWSD